VGFNLPNHLLHHRNHHGVPLVSQSPLTHYLEPQNAVDRLTRIAPEWMQLGLQCNNVPNNPHNDQQRNHHQVSRLVLALDQMLNKQFVMQVAGH
jgi:hypothetical protein